MTNVLRALGLEHLEKEYAECFVEAIKPDHILKSWVGLFEPVFKGEKTHDLRVMDRDYKVGDICELCEYDPITKNYTGRTVKVRITYITSSRHGECAASPTALHPATGILSIVRV